MTRQQERSAAKRTRITVDVTPELRRRIKIAAAERDVSVRDYVVGILERAVPTGVEEGYVQGLVTTEMIETFRRIRDDLMEGRTFTDDSTDLINEAREERDAGLERASRG